jgi:hypothetical protein
MEEDVEVADERSYRQRKMEEVVATNAKWKEWNVSQY